MSEAGCDNFQVRWISLFQDILNNVVSGKNKEENGGPVALNGA
jgi:hypothetical protein